MRTTDILKVNYLIYPCIPVGYFVNDLTTIALKAGFARENWHIDYESADDLQIKKDFDINGWLVGVETFLKL